MHCEEVQTQLAALLDGELTPEAAATIESHLTGCALCSERCGEIRVVLAMTQAWTVEAGEVLAAVQQQVLQEEMQLLRREMQRLRDEVGTLCTEVAELKSREARRAATTGRERAALRFPYATAPGLTRPVL